MAANPPDELCEPINRDYHRKKQKTCHGIEIDNQSDTSGRAPVAFPIRQNSLKQRPFHLPPQLVCETVGCQPVPSESNSQAQVRIAWAAAGAC
jgi:hypothetical protein